MYNSPMLEIVKAFLSPEEHRQDGLVQGQYYERTGSCNQCGKCCTNIYLIHGQKVIDSLPLFESLKLENPEYQSFKPVLESDDGLLFQCIHLQSNGSCGIYDQRPDFCRKYPSEHSLLMGGKLAEGCGYQFRLLNSFKSVLQQLAQQQQHGGHPV